MGANMGKQPPCTYGFPPRRRGSNIENGNHFSKDYWGKMSPTESSGKVSNSEFWMIDSEERYRQEVFHRKSDNFYPSASTYKNQNNFESSFAKKPPKPLSENMSCLRSNSLISHQPPPYNSGSFLQQQTKLRSNPPKYHPNFLAGM